MLHLYIYVLWRTHRGKNRLLRIVATEQSSFCLYCTTHRLESPPLFPSFRRSLLSSPDPPLDPLLFPSQVSDFTGARLYLPIKATQEHKKGGKRRGGRALDPALFFLRSKTDQEKHNIFPMQEKNESNASFFVLFLLKRFRRICPC